MKPERIFAVFFSPTHGTRAYVEGIAARISGEFISIDLTRPENREKTYCFHSDDLVIFGAPVYAGRLPVIPGKLFSNIRGDHTPAVFTVTYGNRDYDDALLEEQYLCERNGFSGIAAAAWIAPHTFSAQIAAGRPDADDLKQIDTFSEKLQNILNTEKSPAALRIRGNSPWKDTKTMPFHPTADDRCTKCGICVSLCPVQAIPENSPENTDETLCIDCFACVRNCPEHCRQASGPAYEATVAKLESALLSVRREPEFFFPEG